MKRINVLGTVYQIIESTVKEYPLLIDRIAYVDHTTKKIVFDKDAITEVEDKLGFKKQVLRHEVIHAFLCESGLNENCNWHCEEMVDWLAIQYPKLKNIIDTLEK